MLHEAVDDGLIELHQTTSTRAYLKEIWDRRDFLWVVPVNDMRARNMDNLLGQVWLLLTPALMVAVYYVIFGVILQTSRGTGNFFAFLVVGLVIFRHSQRTMSDATSVIQRNVGLIKSIQFPRAMVVFAGVITQFLAFLPSILVIFAVLTVTGFGPNVRWLLFPVVILAQLILNLGVSLVFARVGFSVRDVGNFMPHIFRLLLYASGTIFAVDRFIESETAVRWLAVNPMYDLLALARWVLMDLPVTSEQIYALIAWCVVLPIYGMWWFRRGERRYGE